LDELGWVGVIGELNEAVRLTNSSVTKPILITTCGIILAGIGLWRSAIFDGRHEINCLEHPFNEDEALEFIISHHQLQRGWSAFICTRLALKFEPDLQQRGRDNMRAGGKYKGSANLPKAQHIDVRREIARIAGVGTRYVSHVKTILQFAHPRIIEALTDGRLKVNCALPWCKVPKAQQVEQLTDYLWERSTHKIVSQSIGRPKKNQSNLDFRGVIDMLQRLEAQQPGSVRLQASRRQHTVILVGRDLLAGPLAQMGLKLA
jgi:hypothetical protein